MNDTISKLLMKRHKIAPTALIAVILIVACGTQAHAQAIPVEVSALDSSKLITYGPEPSYTAFSKRQHIEGLVRLQFTVRADGTVSDISDLGNGSTNKALVDSSIEALSLWKYKPYFVGGKPTAMRTTVQFKFDMEADIHVQTIYK